jgi:hypothetical protein
MKVVDRFNVSKAPEGPRKFTFEFTGPGLVSVVVVAVIGVAWIFILGVLVGRGYKPENVVPQVAQIMPSTQAPAGPENKEQPTVLKPEELQFQDTLQGRKPQDTVTVDSAQKTGDDATAPQGGGVPGASGAPGVSSVPTATLEKTPAPLPKGQVATARAEPDKKVAKSEPDKSKDAKESKDSKDAKGSKEAKFRWTYQVAAVDTKSQAESEVERLKKKGVICSAEEATVSGKPVYRIMVHLKGTEAEIRQTLDKTGAKKPILRDKKSL